MAWERRETFYFVIDSFFKGSAFTAVKRKGYLFREKWYINGKGLVLGAEPPRINISWVTPPRVFVLHCFARYRGSLACMFCIPAHRGPTGTCLFVRAYAREQDEIWKKPFSIQSHDLYWENKTYKLKRFVREVKHHVTSNVKRKFVPRDQVSPLQYTCRLLFIISTHK